MKKHIVEQEAIYTSNDPSPLSHKEFIQFRKELKEFILDFIVRLEDHSPNAYDPFLCHICINYKNCEKVKLMQDENSFVYLADLHRMAAKPFNDCFFPNIITQKSIPVLLMSKWLNKNDYVLLRRLIKYNKYPIYNKYVQFPNIINKESIVNKIKSFLSNYVDGFFIIFIISITLVMMMIKNVFEILYK